MLPRRSAIALVTFLIIAGASAADAAPASRCEAVTSSADSFADAQALRIRLKADTTESVESGFSRISPENGLDPHGPDRIALVEMLRGTNTTPLRWDRVPELVVLMPVMQYEKGGGTEYRATAEQITDEEASELAADLTAALSLLTDDAFRGFSAVRRETVAAGEVVNVMRPGQIVVARYSGVRDQLNTIGFGGRSTRGSTIRAGSIILDSDFDRTNGTRHLLRMHELGHALGYNHVVSRVSIMNPKIGPEPTDFDRAAARVAFQRFQPAPASCS